MTKVTNDNSHSFSIYTTLIKHCGIIHFLWTNKSIDFIVCACRTVKIHICNFCK